VTFASLNQNSLLNQFHISNRSNGKWIIDSLLTIHYLIQKIDYLKKKWVIHSLV